MKTKTHFQPQTGKILTVFKKFKELVLIFLFFINLFFLFFWSYWNIDVQLCMSQKVLVATTDFFLWNTRVEFHLKCSLCTAFRVHFRTEQSSVHPHIKRQQSVQGKLSQYHSACFDLVAGLFSESWLAAVIRIINTFERFVDIYCSICSWTGKTTYCTTTDPLFICYSLLTDNVIMEN